MTTTMSNRNKNFFALLIGVDFYFPNILPYGGQYNNLRGCVHDINMIENFFQKVGINEENIIKLTSSINKTKDGPLEVPEKLPTYSNIVRALENLIERSHKGDQVYIHYSGHGGRTLTHIPNVKGINGIDKTLVPCDIGNASSQYIRDTELAKIIAKMLAKELVVTLILDSCHSGGATRDKEAFSRSINIIDTTPRPQDSIVASIEELENTWKSFENNYGNSLSDITHSETTSGWLPQVNGYVLLAACKSSESAYENNFEGNESNGALTYWMLKTLSRLEEESTFKQLHQLIVSNFNSQFPIQTPTLEGDLNRKLPFCLKKN